MQMEIEKTVVTILIHDKIDLKTKAFKETKKVTT